MKILISSAFPASVVARSLWLVLWCCLALPSAFAKQHYTYIGDSVRGEYNATELKFLSELNRFPIPAFVPDTRVFSTHTTATVVTTSTPSGRFIGRQIPYLRRETGLDAFGAQVLGVREQPNRWLRAVLGIPADAPRRQEAPAPKTKPNEYRLHTGIKHATSRRSRYL